MTPAVLQLDGIRCRLGGLQVLDGIDLTVQEGAIVALIGGNGSGKTTLLDVVSGFTTAQAGSIRLAGTEMSRWLPHARSAHGIGRVFQESRVWADWTVNEHLSIAARCSHEVERKGILELATSSKEVASRLAGELPLFNRRKLELAMAAFFGSEILLVDEIAAGLNSAEADFLYGHVSRFVREGRCRAALLIEHKIGLLLSYATELCLLREGRISGRASRGEEAEVAELVGHIFAPNVPRELRCQLASD